jgi:putative glutamine amidotransferase
MTPPLIGITQRRLSVAQIAGSPPTAYDQWMNAQFMTYARAVASAGGLPVYVSREADAAELAWRLDGLVVAGGLDVDPRLYGRVPGPRSTVIDPDSDRFEIQLVHAAFRAGIPVLGVCRGLHVLNVALGGTLVPDLPAGEGSSHSFLLYPPHERVHRVTLDPGSTLFSLYGPEVMVNSLHHQAVDDLGRIVKVVGRSEDGVVEAIEVTGHRALGVQWHPEFFRDLDPVFEWLVEEASSADAQESARAGEGRAG